MITLPPGFDIDLLVADFVFLATPFVTLALLFVAYRLITRSTGGIH